MRNRIWNVLMIIIALSIFVITGHLVSATSLVTFSDQGTDVRTSSTGELLISGNLTIDIYDSATGGNLLYEKIFANAIVNGTWNVILDNFPADFGKTYYKDYIINGDNLNFDGADRLAFMSPLGELNITSNITLGQKITFFLGGVIDNIVNGWLTLTGNVNVTQDLAIGGNVVVSGTSLKVSNTEVCLANGTNCQSSSGGNASWNQAYANTLYAPNTTAGIQNLLNSTGIYSQSGGNASWNESGARTIFALNTTLGIQSLYNSTALMFAQSVNSTSFTNNLTATSCSSGHIAGIFSNGTISCTADAAGGGGNPFDQVLNTTSDVSFDNIYSSGIFNISNFFFANGSDVDIGGQGTSPYDLEIANTAYALNVSGLFYANTSEVGIGVVNPAYSLEIARDAKALNVSGLFYANTSNVGIGTSTPTARLEIPTWAGGLELNVSNLLFVNTFVGIGTSTPSNTLDVRGTGNFSGEVYVRNGTKVNGRTIYELTANVTTGNSVTYNATLFTIPISAAKNYTFDGFIWVSSNGTTSGVQLNLTTPTSPTFLSVEINHPTTATAPTYVNCNGAIKQCLDSSGTSTTTFSAVEIHGRILNVNAGNIILNMKSELNASAAVAGRGSYFTIEEEYA